MQCIEEARKLTAADLVVARPLFTAQVGRWRSFSGICYDPDPTPRLRHRYTTD